VPWQFRSSEESRKYMSGEVSPFHIVSSQYLIYSVYRMAGIHPLRSSESWSPIPDWKLWSDGPYRRRILTLCKHYLMTVLPFGFQCSFYQLVHSPFRLDPQIVILMTRQRRTYFSHSFLTDILAFISARLMPFKTPSLRPQTSSFKF
jgi:hypothetical protein